MTPARLVRTEGVLTSRFKRGLTGDFKIKS